MLKIAILSDSHNLDFPFPEADFFIHCGDMTNRGGIGEVARFAQKLNASDYQAGAIVPGNHDRIFQTMPGTAKNLFHKRFRILVDEDMTWKGLRFWGSPWTLPFGEYAFMKTDHDLERVYKWIPQKLDILITHGPALGVLDETADGQHVGSLALVKAIESRQIAAHVFGHIHHQAGKGAVHYRNGTLGANVCVTDIVDGYYVMRYNPIVVEVDNERV